ncbi:hypothetical protein M23134_06749 [Microscilla marina ATCC 23134]|uniref:Uncharacterized protein n=1 Tax=Microscilla marina ATCC 23134 TaxID=313606 RepID=A1ZXS9_MICM2|nr:hypothetical protein M23134_06749 [Microscilla marina ATCC 23134]
MQQLPLFCIKNGYREVVYKEGLMEDKIKAGERYKKTLSLC